MKFNAFAILSPELVFCRTIFGMYGWKHYHWLGKRIKYAPLKISRDSELARTMLRSLWKMKLREQKHTRKEMDATLSQLLRITSMSLYIWYGCLLYIINWSYSIHVFSLHETMLLRTTEYESESRGQNVAIETENGFKSGFNAERCKSRQQLSSVEI